MTFDLESLIYFGWFVIIAISLWIVVSFLLGRHHLVTARNSFLLGMVPFIGSSAIACATYQDHFGQYSSYIIKQYFFTFSLFIVVFAIVYAWFKPPKLIVNYFVSAPAYTRSQPLFFAFFAIAVMALAYFFSKLVYVPVLSELSTRVAPFGAIFGTVFAFGVWMRDRSNPLFLAIFLFLFAISCIYAVYSGGGRRILLGVVGGLGVYYYWNNLIDSSRIKTVAYLTVFVTIVFLFMTAYSEVRHFDRGKASEERTFEKSAEVLLEIPNRILNLRTSLTSERFHSDFGQNGVNCSLYCIYLSERWAGQTSREGLSFPQYLHTFWFVAANPIPRRLWSYLPTRTDKPNGLGLMLPKYFNRGFRVNWGPGLVGHCFHEGGAWMAVFYGVFFALLFKCFDAILINQRSNLFVIGWMAAALPQVAMLSRGDNGIVMLNILFSLILFILMRKCAFLLYGREKRRNSRSRFAN